MTFIVDPWFVETTSIILNGSCTLTNLRRVHLQLLFSSLILHAYNGWIWVECPQIFDKFWVMILSQTDVTIVWASLKHMRYLNHERTQIPSQSIKTRKNITSDWTFTMSSWPLKIAQKDLLILISKQKEKYINEKAHTPRYKKRDH